MSSHGSALETSGVPRGQLLNPGGVPPHSTGRNELHLPRCSERHGRHRALPLNQLVAVAAARKGAPLEFVRVLLAREPQDFGPELLRRCLHVGQVKRVALSRSKLAGLPQPLSARSREASSRSESRRIGSSMIESQNSTSFIPSSPTSVRADLDSSA
jgi:hypothetical protein